MEETWKRHGTEKEGTWKRQGRDIEETWTRHGEARKRHGRDAKETWNSEEEACKRLKIEEDEYGYEIGMSGCQNNSVKKCAGHCKECFEKLLYAQAMMNLATGDTGNAMTMHNFADLFTNVLFPLFT